MDPLLKALRTNYRKPFWFWIEDEMCIVSTVSTKSIQQASACYFGVALHDLRCDIRLRPVIMARHVAIYLCRQLTNRSYPTIGRQFGYCDHSAALYADRKIKKMLEQGHPVKHDIDQIRARLLVASALPESITPQGQLCRDETIKN